MKKTLLVSSILFFLGMAFVLGCNKIQNPYGVYAPLGLDRPTSTATPSTGAINCYVYDGSPKQGVTVVLIDPAGNTVSSKATDQFGNSFFDPSPLVVGNYKAIIPAQGKYGLSTSPITITSTSQGAVSILFWAGSQALTITSGAPTSFTSGTGNFPMTLAYKQPGTLDVPISVTNNIFPVAFSSSPTTFVMSMAVSNQAITIAKTACAVLNQPVTWTGKDFLGTGLVMVSTTLYRNFPINVQLDESYSTFGCGEQTCYTETYTLSSPSDCNTTWTLNGSDTSNIYYLSNNQSVTFSVNNPGGSVTVYSPLGIAIGSGGPGVVINSNF